VAIIGDGAMTAGMAFEALNNAGVTMPTCWSS
jgi:deoxyxylulose-5-phosphate synthase